MEASKTLTPRPRTARAARDPEQAPARPRPATGAPTAPVPVTPFLRERPALHAEVWVYDRALTHVVLVEHPWRGLVPPGGAVEPGETPREAALRAVGELTDLEPRLLDAPAAAMTRTYRSGWAPTLCLAFATVMGGRPDLAGSSGHTAVWHELAPGWTSWFPGDAQRIRAFARTLRG